MRPNMLWDSVRLIEIDIIFYEIGIIVQCSADDSGVVEWSNYNMNNDIVCATRVRLVSS